MLHQVVLNKNKQDFVNKDRINQLCSMVEKNILANTTCINTVKATGLALQLNDFMYLQILSFTCTYYDPINKLQSLPSYVFYNISKLVNRRKI